MRQEWGQLSYLRAEWKWKIGAGWKERERDSLRGPSDLLHLVISGIQKSQGLLERRHQPRTEVLIHEPLGEISCLNYSKLSAGIQCSYPHLSLLFLNFGI